MTSEAAVMSKPLSCGNGASSPTPTVIRRRTRSSMSRHRRQVIVAGSMPSSFPWMRCASIAEASRLLAAAIACRSPVKCRLMSSRGTTWARPAPVPPPFAPSVGPTEGSRRQTSELSPMWPSPSCQRDRGRRLALAGFRGRDCRDRDQLAVGSCSEPLEHAEVDLRFVATVELDLSRIEVETSLRAPRSAAAQIRPGRPEHPSP